MKDLSRCLAWPLAALFIIAPAAQADDVAALRAELTGLRAEYEQRIAALESRIDELEAGQANAPGPVEAATPVARGGSASDPTAFNPAISVILAGQYAQLSEDPETYRIAGFMPGEGETGPGGRGFSLGESELTLSASVDPYFSAALTAALESEGEIGVEEAFFRTTSLPAGFTLKGGRFYSGIGYLNEIHAHAWDFVDQPLAYQAFFGGQYAQDGVQLKWIAPTDLFLELGAETGNGGAFPGTRLSRNGLNGVTLFAHAGGDLGDTVAWRAGLSWLDLDALERTYEDEDAAGMPVTNAFSGSSRTWVADATLKWAPFGDPQRRELKLQAEYLHRVESGTLAFDVDGAAMADRYRSSQSGWYAQAVYRFLPRWRAGLRYDSLDSGSPDIGLVEGGVLGAADFPLLAPASPSRVTAMLDFSPSEFSRLRAQFAWDDARNAERDRQLVIQYIYAIGAHGAHKF